MGFAQTDPQPPTAPIIKIDLGGLADLIWSAFITHITDLGNAVWTPMSAWLEAGLRSSAEATWNSMFLAVPQLIFQLPLSMTTNLPAYQAIALNPGIITVGGATLALVLLGLRTLFGAIIGHDHVVTHVTGRIIPATAMAGGYVTLVAQAIGLINQIGGAVGGQAFAGMLAFPSSPNPSLILAYAVVWLFMIWFAVRLIVRLGYGLFRFLIALVFGPVAIILWAIPQTEWVTSFWLREFIGWGTSPILVAVALAMAIPLAAGQAGFLGAVVFGIAGLQVAHDVVGLLAASRGGGGGWSAPFAVARQAAGGATGGAATAAALPTMQAQEMADRYGFN